jgi:hypothetical protein
MTWKQSVFQDLAKDRIRYVPGLAILIFLIKGGNIRT